MIFKSCAPQVLAGARGAHTGKTSSKISPKPGTSAGAKGTQNRGKETTRPPKTGTNRNCVKRAQTRPVAAKGTQNRGKDRPGHLYRQKQEPVKFGLRFKVWHLQLREMLYDMVS